MKIASHAEKIERLAALRRRLDPLEDFELWYWATLTAGTNLYNASMHAVGATRDDRIFSTIPGVHMVPQPDGTWVRELRAPGDVSHVGWPPIVADVPQAVRRLEQVLHSIEEYRDPCVRGTRAPSADVVAACEAAFDEALQIYRGLVPPERT